MRLQNYKKFQYKINFLKKIFKNQKFSRDKQFLLIFAVLIAPP